MQEQKSSVDRSRPWTRKVPLDELQVFWAWAVDQGRDGYVLEPDWAARHCLKSHPKQLNGRQKARREAWRT